MKNIIYTFFLIITYFSFSQNNEEKDKFEVNFYGNKFPLAADSNDNKKDSSGLISKGKILSSCPKKGCWVKVISNSEEILIIHFSNSSAGLAFRAGKEPITPALHCAITSSGYEIINKGAARTGSLVSLNNSETDIIVLLPKKR